MEEPPLVEISLTLQRTGMATVSRCRLGATKTRSRGNQRLITRGSDSALPYASSERRSRDSEARGQRRDGEDESNVRQNMGFMDQDVILECKCGGSTRHGYKA